MYYIGNNGESYRGGNSSNNKQKLVSVSIVFCNNGHNTWSNTSYDSDDIYVNTRKTGL